MKLVNLSFLSLFFEFGCLFFFMQGIFKQREKIGEQNKMPFFNNPNNKTKMVIIIIDALRIDYAAKIGFINSALQRDSSRSALFVSLAELPSLTSQRIISLFTGNFPSLINMQENLTPKPVVEDTIFKQAKQHQKHTIQAGDEIWNGIFPNQFYRVYPNYKSLNAFDVKKNDELVDTACYNNIFQRDWDLIICHFLGLDHDGHMGERWFKNHQQSEYTFYSRFMEKMYQQAPDDTMFIVTGDHGMTNGGSHGGGTPEELTTAVFFRYKGYGHLNKAFTEDLKYPQEELKMKEYFFSFQTNLLDSSNYIRQVDQVDIVPTIATLLNINIPFENLGTLIPEAIVIKNQNLPEVVDLEKKFIENNLKQIQQYIERMQSEFQTFPENIYENWFQRIKIALSKLNEKDSIYLDQKNAFLYSIDVLKQIQIEGKDFLLKVINLPLLNCVVLLFILTSVYTAIILHKLDSKEEAEQSLFEFVTKNRKILLYIVIVILIVYFIIKKQFFFAFCIFACFLCVIYILANLMSIIRLLIFSYKEGGGVRWIIFFAYWLYNFELVRAKYWVEANYYIDVFKFACMGFFAANFFRIGFWTTIWLVIGSPIIFMSIGIAQQYDNFDRSKPFKDDLQKDIFFSQLPHHHYILINILPQLILFLAVKKYKNYIFRTKEIKYQKVHNCLITLNKFLLILYFNINYYSESNLKSKFQRFLIPELTYLLVIFGIILNLFNKEKRNLLQIYFLFLILQVQTASIFVYIYTLEFVTIFFFMKILQYLDSGSHSWFYAGILPVIRNYFWIMHSNRHQMGNLKLIVAFTGFETFYPIVSGLLVALNTFGGYFFYGLILPEIYEFLTQSEKVKKENQLSKHMIQFRFYFFMATGFQILQNLQDLGGTEMLSVYFPKLCFNFAEYICVLIGQILSGQL